MEFATLMAGSPVLYQCGDNIGVASIVTRRDVVHKRAVLLCWMRLGYYANYYAGTEFAC